MLDIVRLQTELAGAGLIVTGLSVSTGGLGIVSPAPDLTISRGDLTIALWFAAGTTAQQIAAAKTVVQNHTYAGNEANRSNVIARFKASSIAGKTPTQIYTAMQTAIAGWGSLNAAKTDLNNWLPLMAALLAAVVMEDVQQ